MPSDRTATTGRAAPFPETRPSVLDRLRSDELEIRRVAFDAVVTWYWKPIYAYLRIRWRAERADAEDLTQAFLATAFEKRYFESYDPAKARFRTFVRVCLDRFAQKERKAASALKRGGGTTILGLDFRTAEGALGRYDPPDAVDADELFRREWVRGLFEQTIDQVREAFAAEGRDTAFRLFEQYDLESAEDVTYQDLAEAHGLTVSQVTNQLAAARRAFRARALENLRAISGTDAEFRLDARDLFGIAV